MSIRVYNDTFYEVADTTQDVTSPAFNAVYLDRMGVSVGINNSASAVATFIDGVLASGTITITDYTLATGAVVTVAGHALTEGVDWTAETSNDVTADNLATAIDALTEVQAANPAAAVITVKAATVGTAGNSIATVLTSGAGVTVQQATLAGGLANAITGTPSFTITIPSHGYSTGAKVNYDVIAGTTIDNLVNNTDYYVIKISDNVIQLATSEELALAGTEIEIAAADDAVGGGSFTLTPATLDADVSFTVSLDGTNYAPLLDSSGDTYNFTTTTNSTTYINIDPVSFNFIKFTVSPQGGSEVDMDVFITGLKNYR